MKITRFRRSGGTPTWKRALLSQACRLTTLALSLLGAVPALEATEVTTLGGGPLDGSPLYSGYVDGDTLQVAQFNQPTALAFDTSGAFLYVADELNDAIRVLDLNAGFTFTFAAQWKAQPIHHPVGVAVDAGDNVYVLNQGDGTLVKFGAFGNLVGTVTAGISSPNGMVLDRATTNIYVTAGNSVVRVSPDGSTKLVVTISASRKLRGITLTEDGKLAVCDSTRNGILLIDPNSGDKTQLTGFLPAGDRFGPKGYARFNSPHGIVAAGGGYLVVTDYGNNRVKVVDPEGTVTNLYGVNSSFWVTGSDTYPGWWDGTVARGDLNYNILGTVESRLPLAVALRGNEVFTSEVFYHLIRVVTDSGLTALGSAPAGAVAAPAISPNSGYYPMGQYVQVSSANQDVYYTTDGTEPSTNSLKLAMNGNVGVIPWSNSTNDLTGLRVKAFVHGNGSLTVGGQSVGASTIGVPLAPTPQGAIFAGIGSTVVVPVVVNLQTNVQVKSYQFRVEVAPNGSAPPISGTFQTLPVSGNEFISLRTAAVGNTNLNLLGQPYNVNSTRGLALSTAASGQFAFGRFAVVALLEVSIPSSSHEGDSYTLSVVYPSATSDGVDAPVSLIPMPSVDILVTNIAYTVGDSASGGLTWYSAGGFGNGELNNADVNNAFSAALGMRVPYPSSDLFNALDAYPPDASGFAGGDGQIRYLDWQVILQRSLRLDPSNWMRFWSDGGERLADAVSLPQSSYRKSSMAKKSAAWPAFHQGIVGAVSVGQVTPATSVQVPVYVKLAAGSSLAGLQFRAVVTPLDGAATVKQAPQLIPAAGFPPPALQQSLRAGETAFGWPLGALAFVPQSSNFLGWVSFIVPPGVQTAQRYTLSFTNVDGAPDLKTEYNLETRSAYIAINTAAAPASTCSDEWKLHYFGSLDAPNALGPADPDGDGLDNATEYLAGTDPLDPRSCLRLTNAGVQLIKGQPAVLLQWPGAPGRLYELQWSSDLANGVWNSLAQVTGDGATASCSDSNLTGTARFYRLRLVP